jgi:PAS domain S-box-containing protein
MGNPVTILHLEDNPADARLVQLVLTRSGLPYELIHVDNVAAFVQALDRGGIRLILCDYHVPGYDGPAALAEARRRCPHVPFIYVSGNIGEEQAVAALRSGATDYVLKDRLVRLDVAVRRALHEAEDRAKLADTMEMLREQAMLLDTAHDAILVSDLTGTIRYWNHGAQALYGWSAEEAVGQQVSRLLWPPGAAADDERLHLLRSEGEWVGEAERLARPGTRIVVQSRWTLVRDRQGNPKNLLIIETDVTEAKRLQAQLIRAQRLESIGALAGGVAHDLNNVLTPIIMAVQLLKVSPQDGARDEWLAGIETSARRGAAMIKQILTFARGTQGSKGPVQLKHVVHDLQTLLKDTFPKTVSFDISIAEEVWPVVGDSTELYQVLMNLCVNARDAMPSGGRLVVRLENVVLGDAVRVHPEAHAGPYLVVTVADTGTGIPPEQQDKVFEPFYTTKPVGHGTGLGLATVAGIVKSHGGFVTLSSVVGRGTEFRVFLPAETGLAGTPDPGHTQPDEGNGETVLVVDDEALVRELSHATLQGRGYRVLLAAGGAEAVAHYAQHCAEIALVVTDLAMPVMNGAAVVQAVRAIRPQVPVIVVSGVADPGMISEVQRAERVKFLRKPYSLEEFVGAVAATIRAKPDTEAGEPGA